MNKELEALENIKHYDTRVGLHLDDYNIIETALNKYKTLEDELGIDLITLFKALKQGYIYYPIDCPNDCYKYKIECLYMKPRIHLYVADGVGGCYMEDYGKTWALTKEELVKENKDE